MRFFRLLSYYTIFLYSSNNPCCGARHLPASTALLGICRPRPLAQVAPPATGGAPIAPLLLSYINQSPCFSNSDTITKARRFILSNEFHFSLKDGLWIYLFLFIEYAPIASKQKGDGGITRHRPFAFMYDFILRNIFSCHRSQTQQRRSH